METKRTIEINGVKLDVDLREATEIHTYRVGDRVKVLIKKYSDTFEVRPGIILGFEPFQKLPSIVVAYIEQSYSECDLKVVVINEASKEVELCPISADVELTLEKTRVLDHFENMIAKKQREIEELEMKRDYFVKRFGEYFKLDEQTQELQ